LGFGFRVWGLGFRVWCIVFSVQGLGFRPGTDLRVEGFVREEGSGFSSGLGVRV